MSEISTEDASLSQGPNRDLLNRELDTVIEHHFTRLDQGLVELRSTGERLYEDFRVLASSFELRRRAGGGSRHPREEDFQRLDLPQGLFRWLHEERHSRGRVGHGPLLRSGPAKPPEGRVEQLLELLAAFGRSMTTDEIVETMVSKGLLEGVSDPRATVSAALSRGTRMGFFDRPSRGVYTVPGGEDGA
ncbi:MAG: winged helix-turn-helix domain-containing protein [Acidimicrobiia bacterium]|nr:winged helix-turn-helix domain-containing protein [Acidimicrobiia bacterium]MBT8194277.1 winged helix-turn-helix domain-containing protein [Acidimicrobiia bacterium]NNJ47129.1 hypothetical protein [Acidimicrobiia bacterium]NNL12205.1 hypothetical protein [Acidimicrobiia bacterium]